MKDALDNKSRAVAEEPIKETATADETENMQE